MAFRNLKVFQKGLLAVVAVAAAAAVAGGIALYEKKIADHAYSSALTHDVPAAVALARANRQITELGLQTYRSILSAQDGTMRDIVEEARRAADRGIHTHLQQAETALPALAPALRGITEQSRQVFEISSRAVALAATDQNAARAFMRETFLPAYQRLRETIQNLTEERLRALDAKNDELSAKAERTWLIVVAALVGGIALGAGLAAWLLLFGVARPMARLAAATRSLAEGRLDTEVPEAGRRDEVGQLADAVL
ncbi:MAG: HAMP domain-containing protein, partial [Acetobacteraceae bacterium]|nr:HAMP domain-containing protein [Acetobacteraceae bacterium]